VDDRLEEISKKKRELEDEEQMLLEQKCKREEVFVPLIAKFHQVVETTDKTVT